MIERVLIAGVDVPLTDVLATVTIRHGRGSVDDGPLASTATLSLLDVPRSLSSAFRVADSLELLLAGDVPRFTGRVTDAAFSDGTLAIIAVSSLSWLGRRPVGLVDYPAELWSARVRRVASEAGMLTTWAEMAGTWATTAGTWDAQERGYVLELGDLDPMLAARPAEPTTFSAYLGALVESNPAAIAQLPSGALLVQELTARKYRAQLALDPDLTVANPSWSMVDEVTNAVVVEWDGGSVAATDPLSIGQFEQRDDKITTELALEADATARAGREVTRRAWPRWEINRAEYLELEPDFDIGDSLLVTELEPGAPAGTYIGIIEGWEDHVTADHGALAWSVVLTLSPPRYSGIGLTWAAMPAAELWADAGTTQWLEPELALAN